MWGIVRQKAVGKFPAPILEHSMQRIMPAISGFRDSSAASEEVTRGLLGRYGPTRVVDTPITEAGFTGAGVGSIYHGLRAFMTFNSSMQATDHIINSAAKSNHVSADQINVPIGFRGLNVGAGVGVRHTQVMRGMKRYFSTDSGSSSQGQNSQAENESNSPNHLRPLSPHLPIYKPQLSSTVSILNRISASFLTAIFLFSYLLCVKIGSIGFTFEPVYQLIFYSSKLLLISAQITALALFYHTYYGLRHIFFRIK